MDAGGKRDLQLTETECQEVDGCLRREKGDQGLGSSMLVGALLTKRPFNSFAVQNTMKGAWTLRNGFVFRELRHSLFLLKFADQEDKVRVVIGDPWTFDRTLQALKEPGGEQPSTIVIDIASFWIRVYDLPIEAMNEEPSQAIGRLFEGVEKVDEPKTLVSAKFMRLRVTINIKQPHRRGVMMKVAGRKIGAKIKYERLPKFCYACGLLVHVEMDVPIGQQIAQFLVCIG